MYKYKVGDRVYVETRSYDDDKYTEFDNVYKGYGIISKVDRDGFYVHEDQSVYVWVNNDKFFPEEIYNSPLFKAMREE